MPDMFTPLMAVFSIMIVGGITQKLKVLPTDTDVILNQYVYYIAFPAIMLIALAETDIIAILHWGFIGGYSLAMMLTYLIAFIISVSHDKNLTALAAIRALNTTFGNTAFIGIPLMTLLFPEQQMALVAAAIASLLSVIMFAFALVCIELAQNNETNQNQNPVYTLFNALFSNPIVVGSLIGVCLSALTITLPESLALMLRQIGNTSSPCALFAIGMVMIKALRQQSASSMFSAQNLSELTIINLLKLVIQPGLAFLLLWLFNVESTLLTMGVLLAALPTAASVYLLAQRYQINANMTAQAIVIGTLLTFISLPIIDSLLSTFTTRL